MPHTDTAYPLPVTITVAVTGELDLAGITFMDCTGLGALIVVRNFAVQTGRRMWISHPRPIVLRVLAATGMLTLLPEPVDSPKACLPAWPPSGVNPGLTPGVARAWL